MKEYPKIQGLYKRDEKTKKFIEGQFSLPELEYLAGNTWECTEKVDGTNIRIGWNGETVEFAGRTDKAQTPPSLLAVLADMFPAEKFAQFDCDNLTLCGEGYGAKIQSGGNYKADGQSFVLFDVLIGEWFLLRDKIEDFASALGIEAVPFVESFTILQAIEAVKVGITSHWGEFEAEGIVLKTPDGLRSRNGQRIMTKIKHKDFAV